MYKLSTGLGFYNDLLDELKLFTQYYDGAEINVDGALSGVFSCTVRIADKFYGFESQPTEADANKAYKRFAKHSLYLALSAYYGADLPWGSLTGIRPTKLAYEFLHAEGTYDGIAAYLQNEFSVSKRKSRTVGRILRAQRGCVTDIDGKVDLYVHVPFCDGRCSYCSFPSADVNRHGGLLDDYVNALLREISSIKRLIKEQNKEILSVYVGGGTPSVLSPGQLARLLAAINCRGVEFTFEAGRPDSVTAEKLAVLKEGGVTRVCINPQSLNDKTLTAIGRRHTSADFFKAYELTAAAGFTVNTDLIAGLQGETFADFAYSLNAVAELMPDNITVHTLSRKRGSELAESVLACGEIEKMMDYAYERLGLYEPYYLYRQKYMVGNLENVGFCLPGKECVNNITVMEELLSVYACGAASISKNVAGASISRHASPKDVALYLAQFEERLARKVGFLNGNCGEKA